MSNSIRSIAGASPDTQVEAPGAAQNTAVGASTAAGGGHPAVDDSAALSPLADLIQTAAVRAGSMSSFRPLLVNQLKSAVADGSYQPQANLVAARVAAALNGKS